MGNAPNPKHGFSSSYGYGRKSSKLCFRPDPRDKSVAATIGGAAIPRAVPILVLILKVVSAIAVAHFFAMAESSAATETNLTFIVSGTVSHQQFGPNPLQNKFSFVARSRGSKWAVSCLEEPRKAFNEMLAVGNEDGVFITLEFNTNSPTKIGTDAPRKKPLNTSQAIVFKNPIPSTPFAEAIGPVWITYLSAHYFHSARSNMLPPPTELNVLGGGTPPPFYQFQLRSFWDLDAATGLPMAFVAMDDGQITGMRRGEFVNAGRYPPPYEKGFTNIVFKVTERVSFSGYDLPRNAMLEVFWVYNSKLEIIHRYLVHALNFQEPPDTPMPEPTTKGIAVVADERAISGGIPMRVEYVTTNRFLDKQEIARLPQSAYVIRNALIARPSTSRFSSGRRIAVLSAFFALTSLTALIFLRSPSRKNQT